MAISNILGKLFSNCIAAVNIRRIVPTMSILCLAFLFSLKSFDVNATLLVDGFNYAVGSRSSGFVTQANDGDGWTNQDPNGQDFGAINGTLGLHPGEDWKSETVGQDIGKPVYAIAHGTVKEIRTVFNSSGVSQGDVVVLTS